MIPRSEAEKFLAERDLTLDDVALVVADAYRRKKDAAVELGIKLAVDTGTAQALIEVAKKSQVGT